MIVTAGSASTTNVVEVLVVEIDDLLRPVTRIVTSSDPLAALRRLLRSAGWRMTDAVDPAPIVTGIETLVDVLDAVLDGVDPEDFTEFLGALDEIRQLIAAIEDLIELIAAGGPVPPTDDELAAFGEDLLHSLLTQWILRKPVVGDVAHLVGLLEVVDLPAAQMGGWLARRPLRASRLRPAMVTEFVADPLGYLADRIVPNGWATSTDAAATNQLLANQLDPLLARVGGVWRIHANSLAGADALRSVGRLGLLEVVARVAGDDGRARFGAEVEFFSAADTNEAGLSGPAVEVAPFGGYAHTFSSAGWSVTLGALVALGGVDAGDSPPAIRVSGSGVDVAPSVDARFDVAAHVDLNSVLGGQGTRMQFGALDVAAFVGVTDGELDTGASIIASGSRIVLSAADLGVVSSVAEFENTIEFDLGLAWSLSRGVTLAGSASLEVEFTEGIDIGGVITLSGLRLRADIAEQLGLSAVTNVGINLGPVALAFEALGLGVTIDFPPGGGNLGAANLAIAIQPPKGIGVRVNAGVVIGGGYLYLDPEGGEYAGVLELSFPAMSLSLKAIGIFTTDLPGDAEGYALLLLIFVEFPAIQLGYGFTLNGVGGILGIQHGVSIDALQAGMRTGAMDSVLFPDDPVANAPALLADLREVFPITPGSLTFGPALQIGWGAGILTISLGLVVQLDGVIGAGAGSPSIARIVLLGQLQVKLPPVDDAPEVIKLLVDILGYYDFQEMELGIDARLRDSHLIGLPLTGSLCVRARFGSDPTFLMAIGGFHPRFTELPPGLPAQDRLGVRLVYGELTVQIGCYTAITSNSFQFGVEANLIVAASDFRVEAYLGFDALFIFTPTFHFTIEFRMGAAVSWNGHDLASIRVRGELSGPGRWEITGEASFSILCWEVEIGFHEAWGNAPALPLTDAPILPEIIEALQRDDAWHASLPGGLPFVTVRQLDDRLVAHPLGHLEGRQKVVPFGLTVERVREIRPTDANRFEVTEVRVGGVSVPIETTQEHFARGEYFDLSEDAKLTTPSFERFDAGVRVGSDDYTAGAAVAFDSEYETAYREQPEVREFGVLSGLFLLEQVRYAAVARSGPLLASQLAGPGVGITVADAPHVLATSGTLNLSGQATAMLNYSLAVEQAMSTRADVVVVEFAELLVQP